jgi:pimeloyl-ACP methyl ester carboxylesterase
MKIEKIRFMTEDELKLFGLLHLPDKKSNKVVIFIHGMHSNCMKERDDIIAEELTKSGIAYFSFNNRGAECIIKISDKLYGSVYEGFSDCIYDINGAISAMKAYGFDEIHLLGHSLGSSKIVYWYNKAKQHDVKTIGLLSLTDPADVTMSYVGKERYDNAMEFAKQKIAEGKGHNFMMKEAFPLPISAKAYLTLFEKGGEIDFIRYSEKDWNMDMVEKIEEPLFMRYGNINETLVQEPETVARMIKQRLNKKNIDIGVINGADHSYHGKEEILAKEYADFLFKNK